MNIVRWISDRQDVLQAHLAEAEAQHISARKKIQELREREAELAKVEQDTGRLGADSSSLKQLVNAARAEIATHDDDLKNLGNRVVQAKDEITAFELHRKLREYCISTLKQETVPILQSRRDVLSRAFISLKFTKSEATSIDITWKTESQAPIRYSLSIVSEEPRVVPGYLPDELQWVPAKWRSGTISKNPPLTDCYGNHTIALINGGGTLADLYWMSSEESIVPLISKVSRTISRPITDWQGRVQRTEHEEMQIDLSPLTSPIMPVLDELLTGRSIDLDRPNGDPFIDDIASMVVKNTKPLSSTGLERMTNHLSRSEINRELGTEWVQFIDSPWTKAHVGVLAKLKYVCESREIPRFHSLDLKGHYGFRVRTRDHTWIVGEVFRLKREQSDIVDSVAQTEIRSDGSGAVRFRNLLIRIESEER